MRTRAALRSSRVNPSARSPNSGNQRLTLSCRPPTVHPYRSRTLRVERVVPRPADSDHDFRLGWLVWPRSRSTGPSGSRPNAPATLRADGIDRSGYRLRLSFCAIDRLPALWDVCRSRRSSSGCSPTLPAASAGGGDPGSSGGCACRSRASSSGDWRLLMPVCRAMVTSHAARVRRHVEDSKTRTTAALQPSTIN